MNDQRETKKFTTPSGKEFELKTYLTAREQNEVQNIFFAAMKIDPATGKQTDKEIAGDIFNLATIKLVETLLSGFDGSPDKAFDRVMDGHPADYDFIAKTANEVVKPNLTAAK